MNENLKAVLNEAEVDGVKLLYATVVGLGDYSQSASLVVGSDVVYANLEVIDKELAVIVMPPAFLRLMAEKFGMEDMARPEAHAIDAEAIQNLLDETGHTDWFAAPRYAADASVVFPELAAHFVGVEEGWTEVSKAERIRPIDGQGILAFYPLDEHTNTEEFKESVFAFLTKLTDQLDSESEDEELEVEEPEDADLFAGLFGLDALLGED